MSIPVLRVTHLCKSFGPVRAVDDVSFTVCKADHLAIVGESGSGKTTLAKMLMGLIKSDSGSIQAPARGLAMVFQDPHQSLDPLWRIESILKEGLRDKRGLSSQDVRQRLEDMLLAVGLETSMLKRFAHEFSGGERQRIAIARALLANPQLLVLDEAVSALDTVVQQQILLLLKRLKDEFHLTTVFISHNLRLVRHFSDKIIVMRQGKIVEEGSVATVFECPVHPYTQQLVGCYE